MSIMRLPLQNFKGKNALLKCLEKNLSSDKRSGCDDKKRSGSSVG